MLKYVIVSFEILYSTNSKSTDQCTKLKPYFQDWVENSEFDNSQFDKDLNPNLTSEPKKIKVSENEVTIRVRIYFLLYFRLLAILFINHLMQLQSIANRIKIIKTLLMKKMRYTLKINTP